MYKFWSWYSLYFSRNVKLKLSSKLEIVFYAVDCGYLRFIWDFVTVIFEFSAFELVCLQIFRLIYLVLFEKWLVEIWPENGLFFMNFEWCVGPLKFDFEFWFWFIFVEELSYLVKVRFFQVNIFYHFGDMIGWKSVWKLLIFSWTLGDSWVHLSSILTFGFDLFL